MPIQRCSEPLGVPNAAIDNYNDDYLSVSSSRRQSAHSVLSVSSRKKRPAPPPPALPGTSAPVGLPLPANIPPPPAAYLSSAQAHSRASSHSSGFDEPLVLSPGSPADTLKSGTSASLSIRSETTSSNEDFISNVLSSYGVQDSRLEDAVSYDDSTLSSTGSRSRKKRLAPVVPATANGLYMLLIHSIILHMHTEANCMYFKSTVFS